MRRSLTLGSRNIHGGRRIAAKRRSVSPSAVASASGLRLHSTNLGAFESLEDRAMMSVSALVKDIGFRTVVAADARVAAAPTNDNFVNAVALSGASASATASNVDATRETGEPNIAGITGGKSVWWTWTPSASGPVQIDTIGSNFDTTLGIYTGGTVGSLTAVAGDDDSGGNLTSKVTFSATANTTYRIGVDGYRGLSGAITLRVTGTSVSPPTNVAASDGSYADRVQLTWTAAAGATGYEVWRSDKNDSGTAVKITASDVTGTSYADTTAASSTTYYYWVKSKVGGGASGFSGVDSGYRSGPANDLFASAVVLSGTSTSATGTNVGATRETGEPNIAGRVGGKSVWWVWTAPAAGSVQIDTIGSKFDTILGVYTGSSVGSLSLVAGDDDSGGSLTSKVTFSATVNTTYRIAVDGYGGSAGDISLRVATQSVSPPTNVVASDGSYADSVQLTWTAAAGATGYEVWRNVTNDSGTAVKITASDVTGTTYADTTAASSTTYYYWVKSKVGASASGFSGGDSGYRSGPANDLFASAASLSGTSASATGTNVGASRESGEPNIVGNVGGKSVWWTWTAPATGPVQIDTVGSNFDTILGVYTGSTVGALTLVKSDDDGGGNLTSKLTFSATASTTYRIAVDGYGGRSGNISLRVIQPSAPTVVNAARAVLVSAANGPRAATLSVLGSDVAGESQLVYTWSATTVPQGATSPTFSVNQSNAAKNSTVTFSAAGTYVLQAGIVNAAGLSVTSSVTIKVDQSGQSVAVINPVTPTIGVGQQRQFTVQEIDQFGKPMASQPTFTWSASRGSIDDKGLFTAPASAGAVVITATSTTSTATTTANVGSNFLNLVNADLAALVQSLSLDGSLNRLDVYQVLLSVGAGGVTLSEINDLKTVLSPVNASSLAIPGYVQVLANDVVVGNPANTRYQGQPLGNLTAGFSEGQMTNLVNKWFKGSDRPAADANGSYGYQQAAGNLFVDGPSYLDAHQGYLGDCYLLATLGAISKSNPDAIRNMFVDNGDGTFTVRFYYPTTAGLTADYVTVDRYLPVSGSSFVYSNSGMSWSSAGNELWMPLAEKAYAQWNETGREGRDGTNRYSAIEGGWMSNVNRQVLGKSSADYSFSVASNKSIFIDAINANKSVTLGTSASMFGLYGGHAYTLIGYNAGTDTFQAYNPWGVSHPGPLTWSQLQQACSWFAVADTSNVPQISSSGGRFIAPLPNGGAVVVVDSWSSHAEAASTSRNRGSKSAAIARLDVTSASRAVGAAAVDRAFATWSSATSAHGESASERTSVRAQVARVTEFGARSLAASGTGGNGGLSRGSMPSSDFTDA